MWECAVDNAFYNTVLACSTGRGFESRPGYNIPSQHRSIKMGPNTVCRLLEQAKAGLQNVYDNNLYQLLLVPIWTTPNPKCWDSPAAARKLSVAWTSARPSSGKPTRRPMATHSNPWLRHLRPAGSPLLGVAPLHRRQTSIRQRCA